jgi:hypothetical protein
MIILIIIYTVLIFLFFALDGTTAENSNQTTFDTIELVILGIFSLEIALHLIAYGALYFKDKWNIFDIFIIMLSIAFVFLDLYIKN